MFDSFGLTLTLWLPALAGLGAMYLADPLNAEAIGEMTQRYRGTLLPTTPALAMTYAGRCAREQFASVRLVLAVAEKMSEPAAKASSVVNAFEEAFGWTILEGYGCTEMSGLVAVNTKGYEAGRESQLGTKAGTVGRPLPGVAVRIVDPQTLEPVAAGAEGLILVRGPSRMLGYLGSQTRTGIGTTPAILGRLTRMGSCGLRIGRARDRPRLQ